MKVVRLSNLRTGRLYPQEILLVLISVRGSVDPQGYSAARRIMSMKNSNDTIGNRTRDLPTCSAVPQPTAPPRAVKRDRCVVSKRREPITQQRGIIPLKNGNLSYTTAKKTEKLATWFIVKDSVRTTQSALSVLYVKIDKLMPYAEITDVCSEKHIKGVDILSEERRSF